VKGPFATPSLHYGNRYQSSYRESKSRLNYLTFLQHKSDVYTSTQSWIQNYIIPLRATNPTLGPIFIVSDMGEFNKEKIRTDLLAPNGIFSITTCPYVPAHNGVVERHWHTLTDATICQLLASNLSELYWEESARCANYIINRITSAHPETHPTSPYEEYFGIAPPISHFRIFGSVCYVKDMLSPKQPRAKSFRGILSAMKIVSTLDIVYIYQNTNNSLSASTSTSALQMISSRNTKTRLSPMNKLNYS